MSTIISQPSFNSGEWAPNLYARVDMQKYHSGAATLRNFFVDYRGGASTRPGTRYVLQCLNNNNPSSTNPIRLIPFQASKSLGFCLEFGNGYIRFHRNGAPVLEPGVAITGITKANPGVISVTNTYAAGQWLYVSGVNGMTQINGRYFLVPFTVTGSTVPLVDLLGNNVNSTLWSNYTSGGTTQRVYTVASPYTAADLAQLKFVQNVSSMIFCHPNYPPYILTFLASASWTFTPITFGSTVAVPTGLGFTTSLAAGTCNYLYAVTAVDANGQEGPKATIAIPNLTDIRVVNGSIFITWAAVAGAQDYNVYRSVVAYGAPVPAGSSLGYIGTVSSTSLVDTNIAPDFSQGPPVIQTPFVQGGSVATVTVTNSGSYSGSIAPATCSFSDPPAGGVTATASIVWVWIGSYSVPTPGTGYAVSDTINFSFGAIATITAVDGSGGIISVTSLNGGQSVGTYPPNPVAPTSTSGGGSGALLGLVWGVQSLALTNSGYGYTVAPTISFTGAGGAAATAGLGAVGYGNPSVPAFFQQRLVLAATNSSPQVLLMSQPGDYFNFNTSDPVQSDDAITANIVSGQLSNIKALISQSGGLLVVTDGVSFLVNGGSLGAAVTPSAIVANQQSYVGSSDVPPIISNYDILTVPAKGSSVRDSTYNFYVNVFTGTDISVLSSHLFFGYVIKEWAWAEEPYKLVWAVRSDGILLSLTFIKEQEFVGWARHDTQGAFKSCCTVTEVGYSGYRTFAYFVVSRTLGNGQTVQLVELMPERLMPNGVVDANTVDCSYQYVGTPKSSFQGATALAGLTCTGLADGAVIPSFVMSSDGTFTLSAPASKVTVGLSFVCQLQTLYLDVTSAADSIQGKQKKINNVTLRVNETLGLYAGTTFNNMLAVKDLVVGAVGSMTNGVVTDLVQGDVRPWIDPKWNEAGQYCFQQTLPYPASILGVFPSVVVGDR